RPSGAEPSEARLANACSAARRSPRSAASFPCVIRSAGVAAIADAPRPAVSADSSTSARPVLVMAFLLSKTGGRMARPPRASVMRVSGFGEPEAIALAPHRVQEARPLRVVADRAAERHDVVVDGPERGLGVEAADLLDDV